MRALITGSSGQLGSDLRRILPDATALPHGELRVEDRPSVAAALDRHRPSVVFNCAAYNAVDRAEGEPQAAMAVNATAAGIVAGECAARGIRLLHFSTNYVFDGRRAGGYAESDDPNPLSAYARSKLEGERAALEAHPDALVVRCAGLYGTAGSAAKGGSFPDRILARARSDGRLRVVADQWLNPTFTGELAAACVALADGDLRGLVHLVPSDCGTWHELAVEIVRLAGLEVPVEPVGTGEFPAAAERPRHGCLRSERLEPLRPWREGLAEYWTRLRAGG